MRSKTVKNALRGRRALALALLLLPAGFAPAGQALVLAPDPAVLKTLAEAKAKLQAGIDDWDFAVMKGARDLFRKCLVLEKKQNAFLWYYVGLADYSLATHALAGEDAAACDEAILDGQDHLQAAIEIDPEFGEAAALQGMLLGLELANHLERAFTLGRRIFQSFDRALELDGDNPRVLLQLGIYQTYLPEAFGGGPESALDYLDKAIALFETERISDPLRPSWGREEALLNAALAHKQMGRTARAVELLKKALVVNPNSGRVRGELAAIEK